MSLKFEGGINIAIKIPKNKYLQTVDFYKNTLKLEVEELSTNGHPTVSRTHKVKFGHNILWLDCVDNYTHSETWLELKVNDVEEAAVHLQKNGVELCDEIEKIPANSHWIMDPAGTVFILNQ
jgi:predicted enzyme related to lactoylglutathione lyase